MYIYCFKHTLEIRKEGFIVYDMLHVSKNKYTVKTMAKWNIPQRIKKKSFLFH